MAEMPPSACTTARVGGSSRLMQSHRMFPAGSGRAARAGRWQSRVRADTGQAGFELPDNIVMIALQIFQAGPLLAAQTDILALVFADRAVRRRGPRKDRTGFHKSYR